MLTLFHSMVVIMSVFDETQQERDIELSELLNKPYKDITKLQISSPDSIRVYGGKDELKTKEDLENLYADFKDLNFPAYLKTLMFTSVERRHPNLLKLLRLVKNMTCLDFGSGVATHAIALAENKNKVTIIDLPGPLLRFAITRMTRRNLDFDVIVANDDLPKEKFDVIICTDVIEHVFDPLEELMCITESIKPKGFLHLQVSRRVEPSLGHFERSNKIWEDHGRHFINNNFTRKAETIYVKN